MNVAPTAVYLTGTFNAWRTKVPLRRRGSGDTTTAASVVEYAVTLALAPGVYRLKFIVDDEWRCSDAMPTAQDEDGNLVNFVEVLAPPPPPQPPLASRGESMVVARSTPPLPPLPPLMSSSPATTAIVQGPDGRPVLEPPVLPAQLTKVVLNGRTATNSSSSSHAAAAAEMGVDETAVGVPAHVSVGHLYACSIRDGVMAVAVTSRYRKKCVTTVVYRAVDI
ncbi:hypothetical protein BC828DRAFT_362874 [Blastocladiella britannica]|nr:hypothetical protein BC828DRAFT_362874 [Blastocladiella britannica]